VRSLRALVEATAGRRLLVRIWIQGVLLFAGVIAVGLTARAALSPQEAVLAARDHPELTLGLAERALALRDQPGALGEELRRLRASLGFELAVFAPDGTVLAASADPPPAPPTAAEREELATPARYVRRGDRFVVGAHRDGELVAYAVAVMPGPPSVLWHALSLLAVALVMALVIVAVPLTRSIARPLEALRGLARELGEGNLAVRAPDQRRDEIGDLSRAFNRMAAQIERLRAAERELLADVSHELRTPLARMRVVLDLASDADPAQVRRYLQEITTDLSELDQLLDDVIVSSRLDRAGRWDEARPPLRRRPLEVRELVEATALRFRERWPARALACAEPAADLVVDGDPVMLRRALDNLVDNARKYSAEDRPITVAVDRAELRGRPAVKVEVVDAGHGIAVGDQPRVFTAFFRADRSRARATGGVGLGLALARRIVEAHEGAVGFASDPDRGSRFWFVLPLA